MYEDMRGWEEIRSRVLRQGVGKRPVVRETGIHWTTLQKILAPPELPGYRRDPERPKPKLGPFVPRIQQILEEDRDAPRKQRHTAKRIFDRLREEGYTGSYRQVRVAVRELRELMREAFMPLAHRPGEAQVDVGHAEIRQGGEQRKVVFPVMCLIHSDAFFPDHVSLLAFLHALHAQHRVASLQEAPVHACLCGGIGPPGVAHSSTTCMAIVPHSASRCGS